MRPREATDTDADADARPFEPDLGPPIFGALRPLLPAGEPHVRVGAAHRDVLHRRGCP